MNWVSDKLFVRGFRIVSKGTEDMLVLSRKQNQEILIGDNIKITVLRIKGNTIRLGIDAPRDVNVLRGELPRHEKTTAATGEQETPQKAEFTVVFSNSGEDQHAKVDMIPFRSSQTVKSDVTQTKTAARTHRLPTQAPDANMVSQQSVQFRGALPAQLQHNRLQEIVKKLTDNPENSNAER